MIKVDKGSVEIHGQRPLVMAELTTLVHALYHNILTEHDGMSPEEAKAQINRAIENGFMTDEQAKEKAKELIGKSITAILDALMDGITKEHGKDDE